MGAAACISARPGPGEAAVADLGGAGRRGSGFAMAFGSGCGFAGGAAAGRRTAAGLACFGATAAGAWPDVPASLLGGAAGLAGFVGALAAGGTAFFVDAGALAFAAGLAAGLGAGLTACGFAADCFTAGLAGILAAADFAGTDLDAAVLDAGGAALRRGAASFFAWAEGRRTLPSLLAGAGRLPDALARAGARAGAFIPDNSPAASAAC
jgi:hypothetical protein